MTNLFFTGIIILLLDMGWLIFYFFYGTAEIYNLQEQNRYKYLGRYFLIRKEGSVFLRIPREVIDNSHTTQYKIRIGSLFARLHENERMRLKFGKEYEILTPVRQEITAKNHIATSCKL